MDAYETVQTGGIVVKHVDWHIVYFSSQRLDQTASCRWLVDVPVLNKSIFRQTGKDFCLGRFLRGGSDRRSRCRSIQKNFAGTLEMRNTGRKPYRAEISRMSRPRFLAENFEVAFKSSWC